MRVYMFMFTVTGLLSILCYAFFRQNFSFGKTWSFFFIFLALALNTIFCRALPDATPLFITKIAAWLSGLWIATGYYLIFACIIMTLLWVMKKLFGLALPMQQIASGLLVFIICFVAWGAYRAANPVLRTEKIVTEKLPTGEKHKIVLLTDLHLGQINGRSYSEELVKKVNALSPDIIVISGDLLDERIRYVVQQDSLSPLKNFNAKQGVYLAYGNHDYLDQPELWQTMVEANNIQVLRDKDVKLGHLKITGINDFSRNRSTLSLENLSHENKDYYSILLDHQPRKMDAASTVGYDLYLAGHTHTGQLWPNRLITKKMYKLDYGRKDFGKMTAITSNGYGFWGPPVRTEVMPEYILIELEGK